MVNLGMANFAPVVRVLFQGKLVALTSEKGVIVYSTEECDQLFGSSSCSRGRNLSHFLLSDLDVLAFTSFLENIGCENVSTLDVTSRIGRELSVQADMRANNYFLGNTKSRSPKGEIKNERSLLSKSWDTKIATVLCSGADELSFNDAFE